MRPNRTSHAPTHRLVVYVVATVLMAFASPRSGTAQESTYSVDPLWLSSLDRITRAVALGDVDGDGDLDLVCGNGGDLDQRNTLYLNLGSVFAPDTAWSSSFSDSTFAVALGDINGDGTLDLICGNYGQKNRLYLNVGNVFSAGPDWESGPANKTTSIILGDVDGDGDLDLVCGNEGQSNTVYLNVGGVLETIPAWQSSPAKRTLSVALGDVDGDGSLDLVCGNNADSNTVYLNLDGVLDTIPAWKSSTTNRTFSVALGDMDGDGDLDLVCGNVNAENTLFQNNFGVLDTTALWLSDPLNVTTAVALGDADGDGDLDLLCGNDGQRNTFYRNNAGTLETMPIWRSARENGTFGIALGDVDGDGDLDLVCGNEQGASPRNTLYRNEAFVLDTQFAWESAEKRSTFGVALGDVDSDGDLDLVCGNGGGFDQANTLYENTGGPRVFSDTTSASWDDVNPSSTFGVTLGDINGDGRLDIVCGNSGPPVGQTNTVYLNNGGSFSTTTDWNPTPMSNTVLIALGDVDGDGDLDLACGNGGTASRENTLYLNTGSMLANTTVWQSGPAGATIGVALGDVDGDGDLDLVCGNNNGQQNTLYLNRGGVFEISPVWSSGKLKDTFGVALGDVDGDGDLVLVCGTAGATDDQRNTLYLNEFGVFAIQPVWESARNRSSTFGVALGDVDGDGDLDFFCGNGGTDTEPNTLYLNEASDGNSRVFSLDPVWSSTETRTSFGVAVGDVDGDGDLDVVYGNESQSNTLYLGKRNPVYKGLPGAPTNHLPNNSAFLDGVDLQGPDAGNQIRVTFTAIDVESDSVWIVAEYQFEGDPEWFPVDRQPSRIGPFATSPGGEMGSFDWDILQVPFDSRDIVLRLRTISVPRRVSVIQHVASYVKAVGSIAPGRPEITTSPGALSFPTVKTGNTTFADLVIKNSGTQVLNVDSIALPSPEITLKQPKSFALAPDSTETLRFFLQPLSGTPISGWVVITSDDPITRYDSIAVTTDIISISSTPIPNRGTEFAEGRDITVPVALPAGASLVQGKLYFRQGGGNVYQEDSLVQLPGQAPRAAIPGSIVGPRGVQYWVETRIIRDGRQDTLTDPPVLPDSIPRSIRITVDKLAFPYRLPTTAYRMISIPLEMQGTVTGTLNELGDKDGGRRWRMLSYYGPLGGKLGYREIPDTARSVFGFEQGRAYWLATRDEGVRLNTGPTKGTSATMDSAFTIVLEPGWNMIANPFDFSVAWASMMVDTLTMAQAEATGVINPPIRRIFLSKGKYRYNDPWKEPVTSLEPFDGYWVWNDTTQVILKIPPVGAPAPVPVAHRPSTTAISPEGEWHLRIRASSVDATDIGNYVGVRSDAAAGRDRHDIPEAPMSPGPAISLYFPHNDWEKHPGLYTVDMRGKAQAVDTKALGLSLDEPQLWGHVWRFDVAKNSEGGLADVVLDVTGIETVPEHAAVYLIDHELETAIDLRKETHYMFFQGAREVVNNEEDVRFTLLVGSDSFVGDVLPALPTRTVLHPNYPNPFNPTTVIRYELASAAEVTIKIYNVTGALVKTLEARHRERGRYEAGWNGDNNRGQKVASGIYFYRLHAGGFTQTRKMILLK